MSELTMKSYLCDDTPPAVYIPESDCECEMLESRVEALEEGKQDLLTAGRYIEITENVISANISEDYYDKNMVDELIGSVESIRTEIVEVLPEIGESNVIYLVPSEGAVEDIYDQYVWADSQFVKIGSTQIDLSNYYTKTESDTLLNGKQNKLTAGANITISNNVISAVKEQYIIETNPSYPYFDASGSIQYRYTVNKYGLARIECRQSEISHTASNKVGSIYRSSQYTWNLPSSRLPHLVAVFPVSMMVHRGNGHMWVADWYPTASHSISYYVFAGTSVSGETVARQVVYEGTVEL